jgi:hypothetical protein
MKTKTSTQTGKKPQRGLVQRAQVTRAKTRPVLPAQVKAARPIPQSIRALADALGVTRKVLSYHVRKQDAPALSDQDGWLAYLAANGRVTGATPELRQAIAVERYRLLKAQADALEARLAERKRQYVPFDEVASLARHICAFFTKELQRLATDLSQKVPGMTPPEINETMLAEKDAIHQSYNRLLDTHQKERGS